MAYGPNDKVLLLRSTAVTSFGELTIYILVRGTRRVYIGKGNLVLDSSQGIVSYYFVLNAA